MVIIQLFTLMYLFIIIVLFVVFIPIDVKIFVWLINTAVIKSSIQSHTLILIILSVSDSIITLLHVGTFSRKFLNNKVIIYQPSE